MRNRKSWAFLMRILTLGALLFVSAAAMNADTSPSNVDYNDLKVIHVWGVDKKNGERTDASNGLYNTIVVEVDKLADWAKQEDVNDASKLILYMDGDPINVNTVKIDKVRENKLSYVLFPRDATEDGWKDLLGRPHNFRRAVSVTVGLAGKLPVASAEDLKIKLTIINEAWFYAYLAGLLVLIIFLVRLARKSNILRDVGPQHKGKNKPFSLGRTQMAFWFLLVIASFGFIFLVTSAYEALSASVLGLIGISAGTALGAAVIDASKRKTAQSDLETLEIEKATLEAEQKPLPAAGSALDATRKTRLAQVDDKIKEANSILAPQSSNGFFKDILSDASGISIHRFQMAIWTLVLGVIFVVQVYNFLAMPNFPPELLTLMGISGGTYLGFKFREKQS